MSLRFALHITYIKVQKKIFFWNFYFFSFHVGSAGKHQISDFIVVTLFKICDNVCAYPIKSLTNFLKFLLGASFPGVSTISKGYLPQPTGLKQISFVTLLTPAPASLLVLQILLNKVVLPTPVLPIITTIEQTRGLGFKTFSIRGLIGDCFPFDFEHNKGKKKTIFMVQIFYS